MKKALLFLLAACGPSSGDAGDAGDAGGVVYGHKPVDAGTPDVADEPVQKVPWNRMTSHGGPVLTAPHIWAVYLGTYGNGGSQSFDAYIQWLLTTPDYWGVILPQYGVGYGMFAGSTVIDPSAFFTPGMITGNLVGAGDLATRIQQVIHDTPADAGTTADDAGDAGDASATLPYIPPADGYVVFLPDNVQVDLGFGEQTCVAAGGYHDYDGSEPYAVIPSCGRHGLVVSHEIAEMCTDPEPGSGWFSDKDLTMPGGGEIGDLCNFPVMVDGDFATALWSNKDGDCEPSN